MKRFAVSLLLIVLFALLIVPALAQGDVPTEPTAPFVPPSPDVVVNGVLTALAAIFAAAMSSPLTVTVVSLVKRLPFLSAVPAQQLNLAVAALLSLIYWGAGVLGFSIQLETVAQVILALVPIFAGTLVNYSSNQGVYNSVKGMPIIGYSRS